MTVSSESLYLHLLFKDLRESKLVVLAHYGQNKDLVPERSICGPSGGLALTRIVTCLAAYMQLLWRAKPSMPSLQSSLA